jgi:hypothetical protein
MEQQHIFTSAEQVASVLSGRGKITEKSVSYQVTVKLPIWLVAKVDAMARQSGKTRTESMSMLLDVGIEEVLKCVDEPVAVKLLDYESEALGRLMGEAL